MKTYMLFHGGPSYAVGGHDDIEELDSLKQAKRIFESRCDFDPYYPCVEDAEAWIWLKVKPENNGDLYPGKILKLGPRGGVRVEDC